MSRKKSGLGRGLDALLSSAGTSANLDTDEIMLRQIPVEQIRRGEYQPRQNIPRQSLEELAESIRAQGIVQPVVLRPLEEGYELIAGERRWRAAQMAGLQEIPAVIRQVENEAAAAMALIENIQREDLNPLEESEALRRLIGEFGLTHQQAAEAVGRSRTAVSNLLRLLDLEKEPRKMLSEGLLEMGHARALLSLQGKTQTTAARHVVRKAMSVRETERYIKTLKKTGAPAKRSAVRPPDIVALENELADRIGAPVRIRCNARGKGRLTIGYNSLDELDGILDRLRGA